LKNPDLGKEKKITLKKIKAVIPSYCPPLLAWTK
jgi:hypothetical protein